jgi:hypothetical protein
VLPPFAMLPSSTSGGGCLICIRGCKLLRRFAAIELLGLAVAQACTSFVQPK